MIGAFQDRKTDYYGSCFNLGAQFEGINKDLGNLFG
jgi:hypothetical protein